jgi:alpha-amylase/alpha-mannosidase (GH57 family)
MQRYICVHGHFYQPPRENAWLEFVELQDSAYPFHDWNERITAECYGPNGMSRILDPQGRITQITNNYAKISFNFGPTLLAWLNEKEPDVYRTILDADKESQNQFSGHGSAIAQAYNHTILPLSTSRDKYTQILWGIRDFEFRFGRKPDGMWLPETAVDLEVLDILAEFGIRFTVLSPYQARRVKKVKARGAWRDVSGGRIDPSTPYELRLPSGRRIAIFFYDGPISQGIAFEKLLQRGENLSDRLMSAFSDDRPWPQIIHIATDGETYGHHHPKGEMGLAYALHHIESNDFAKITNYAEYLSNHPPTMEAEIWERSAWSCAHGLERWNSNCGCNTGAQPSWNQEWRRPLRQALDWLRDEVAPRFEEKGREFLHDPWRARDAYIDVILDRSVEQREKFFGEQATRPLTDSEKTTVLKLMEMQRHAMLMYTSCGWFFDDLSGIETTQVIQYAARTLQLFEDLFGASLEPEFLNRLELAQSNVPEHENGRVIYESLVRPAMVDREKVAAHYALSTLFRGYPDSARVYCYTATREDLQVKEAGRARVLIGKGRITSEITLESDVFSFGAIYIGDHVMNAGVRAFRSQEEYTRLQEELADPFERADFPEVIRLLDRHFGESTYSLKSIFHDDQRTILNAILESAVGEGEAVYRQLYETHAPMMRFMNDLRIPAPRVFHTAAEFALNNTLRGALEDLDNFDSQRVHTILDEVRAMNVDLDYPTLGFALRKTIEEMADRLAASPNDIGLMRSLESASRLAQELPFPVVLWRTQNRFYELLQSVYPQHLENAQKGEEASIEWVRQFLALGGNLSIHIHPDPAHFLVAA